MLLNTLDTFIGFAGIMLTLSLLVTALVQFVQNGLQLRARNLRSGLESLLEKLFDDGSQARSGDSATKVENKASDEEESNAQPTPALTPEELRKAVLELAPFVPSEPPKTFFHRVVRWLERCFSPTTTWVSPAELIEHLDTKNVRLSTTEKERLPLLFQRMEDYMRKRFISHVRMITIACAALVAGYFQLSTPELLGRLSRDDTYRARAASEARMLAQNAPALLAASTNYQNVSAMALSLLATRHPEHAALIERASGLGQSREEIVDELKVQTASLPPATQTQLICEYEQALTDLHVQAMLQSREQMGFLTDQLGRFDITPWPHGWSYYNNLQNCLGVVMTAIFLTFGAPFWYERLRDLIQLRDALKPKQTPEKKPEDSVTPSGDSEKR